MRHKAGRLNLPLIIFSSNERVIMCVSSDLNVQGVVVASKTPPVNHLIFVDDCLLMFKENLEGATITRDAIRAYYDDLGQPVNLSQLKKIEKSFPSNVRTVMKEFLDVPNESPVERYLGLPSDVGYKKWVVQVY